MRLTKTTIITSCVALAAPLAAFAQYGLEETAEKAGISTEGSLAATVGNIISIALGLVGVIFLVLMVYGGYLWMIARGNEDLVTKAKDTIRSSIIGVVIVAGAYAITSFLVSQLSK